MNKQVKSLIPEVEEINRSWKISKNGNYYNHKILTTVFERGEKVYIARGGDFLDGQSTVSKTKLHCALEHYQNSEIYRVRKKLMNILGTKLEPREFKKTHTSSDPTGQKDKVTKSILTHSDFDLSLEDSPERQKKYEIIDWDEAFMDLEKRKKSFKKKKKVENKPKDILDTWITFEVLEPQTYKIPSDLVNEDKKNIASLNDPRLPWETQQSAPKGYTIFYQIILGALDVQTSSNKLLELYKDDFSERVTKSGRAALGVIFLDHRGAPIEKEENAISLASFPWGYGRALNNKLEHLKYWNIAESILLKHLRTMLCTQGDNGAFRPLTKDCINRAYEFLIQNCNIPMKEGIPPSFAIKKYIKWYNKDDYILSPDSPVLNSFYLKDLQKVKDALEEKTAGKAILQYLQDIPSPEQKNVLQDEKIIESNLEPRKMPSGRWPGAGRHPLVLLQQLAVNLSQNTLKDGGILSVNGPPGTGKTTLLRDIVASNIIERAKIMLKFSKPSDAFKKSDVGGLYHLDEGLKGYETLVASSNNKAVENISKELPQKSQVTDELLEELRYFRSISDALSPNQTNTWGLCAATLGNSKNKYKFVNLFWQRRSKDENVRKNNGLRTYLDSVVTR